MRLDLLVQLRYRTLEHPAKHRKNASRSRAADPGNGRVVHVVSEKENPAGAGLVEEGWLNDAAESFSFGLDGRQVSFSLKHQVRAEGRSNERRLILRFKLKQLLPVRALRVTDARIAVADQAVNLHVAPDGESRIAPASEGNREFRV